MSAGVALPIHLKESADTIVTMIVPAPDGCNLDCPFCFIKQRNEPAEQDDLKPSDYVRFVEEIVSKKEIAAICIQGYEPLLPESFDYTRAILITAQRFGIASSLITNGTYLADRVADLEKLGLYRIFVSIDADNADAHDHQRGKVGAFDAAVRGLEYVSRSPILSGRTTVVSVLISKKRDQLLGLPALLKRHGLDQWVVNPLINISENRVGRYQASLSRIFHDALVLKREADKHGIELIVDDEFDRLSKEAESGKTVNINARRFLSIQRLKQPGGVFRLMPNGQCSVGLEILQKVSPNTPCWIPGEMDAADFIQSLHVRADSHAG